MQSFKQYLSEARNTHLEHLEDDIINNGYEGGLNAIQFLTSLRNMMVGESGRKVNVSTKWDGAPAIVCGTNPENGRFFVATKSLFNVTPKINYTNSDIRRNHAGALVDKLEVGFKYLKKLNIRGVDQGDLLFTPKEIKSASIRGEKHIAFRPNTITYAVPEDSDLAKRILKAKLGIIFHTTYSGRTIDKLKAGCGVSVNSYAKTSDVFFDNASYRDTSGVATFTQGENNTFTGILRMAIGSIKKGKRILNLLRRQTNLLSVGARLKIFFNDYIKKGQSYPSTKQINNAFRKYYASVLDDEVSKRKTPAAKKRYETIRDEGLKFIDKYDDEIYFAIASYLSLTRAKNFLVAKMNQVKSFGTFIQTDKGWRVTNPEGFVAVDTMGNAVKLVDRLEFSTANFTLAKNWIKG